MSAREVALFGGSFDPPHVGHVLAVSYALSVGFDSVLVVPTFEHAFGKASSPFEHRVAMAQLAFAPLPAAVVSRIEETLPVPSRTLATIECLRARDPDEQLRLLIGADLLLEKEK